MRRIFLFLLLIGLALPVHAQDDDVTVTDGLRHSVPLEDIIFDDFDIPSRFRRLSDASPDDIERLRDRIRPMCHGEIAACLPVTYEDAASADTWLLDVDMVIGFIDAGGQAYAYPFDILNFHEIVNDTLAGDPVLVSYCPLCNSAVVFSRVLDGEATVFGNTSALYNSDMVMYDQRTDSFWVQVEGRAVVGELTGTQLAVLPSAVAEWSAWLDANPETLVLARPNTGIDYTRDIFGGYAARVNDGNFLFPVDEAAASDARLRPADTVLVVQAGEVSRAYPLAAIGNAAVRDTLGETEILVLSLEDGPTGAAFSPVLDDGARVDMTFDDGAWRDRVTGSTFDLNGRALDGPLEGAQLTPLPVRYTYWFAAVASLPDVEVFTPRVP